MTARELLDRLRPDPAQSQSLGANTVSLAAARVAPMVTGFAFWALAALALPPGRLGLGSALVSAVLLSVQLALLGIGPATVSLLPGRMGGGHRLVTASLAAVTCSSLVVGAALVLITRSLGGPTGAAWDSTAVVLAFMAATVLATLAYQLDHVAIARSSSQEALRRSVLQGVVQLGGLAVGLAAGGRGVLVILIPVAAGALASVSLGLLQQWRRGWRPGRYGVVEARLLVRHGLPNHALMLSDRAPGYLLPLIVTAVVSTSATASWYMVWMLSAAVFFVPQSAGFSLQAKLAGHPGAGRELVRKALGLSVLLTAASAVLLVTVGPMLLAFLGPVYAGGWPLLLIMAPALMAGCVTQVYFGLCRARQRLAEATVVAVVAAVVAVAPAAMLAGSHGLQGVSLVWLAGQVAAGLIAAARLRTLTAVPGRLPRHARVWVPLQVRLRTRTQRVAGRWVAGTAAWLNSPGLARFRSVSLGLSVLAAAALAGGLWSLPQTDVAMIGSIGIVSALPAAYFPALAASVLGVVFSLARRKPVHWVLLWQLVVLIVLMHGIDPIVHGTPRLEASYRHLGITSYIAGSGQLDTNLDAYFSWPGFFALLAMISDATGSQSLMPAATWAPLAANLLLLPVLLALALRLVRHWRTAWAAVWLFYLTTWVGQDYLSPQAYAFQLGLTVVTVVLVAFGGRVWGTAVHHRRWHRNWRRLLDWLEPGSGLHGGTTPAAPLPRAGTVALLGSSVLILAAITAAHQLTPFAVAAVLVGLTLAGQSRLRFLPVLAVLLPICWLLFVATPYLVGHESTLFGSIGDLTQTVAVTHRVAGDPGHRLVVAVRVGETALMWGGAALGAVLLRHRRRPWVAAATAAGIPLLLLPLQPYGGELLMRVYLYSLPLAACLAAVALMAAAGRHPGWRRCVVVAAVGLALAGTTLVTRYGNDAMETFTPAELALVRQLDAVAPPGAVVIEAVHDTPWRFTKYATYRYQTLLPGKPQVDAPDLTCQHVELLAGRVGAYLIVTASQVEAAQLLGIGPPGAVATFVPGCILRHGWTTLSAGPAGILVHIDGVHRVKNPIRP